MKNSLPRGINFLTTKVYITFLEESFDAFLLNMSNEGEHSKFTLRVKNQNDENRIKKMFLFRINNPKKLFLDIYYLCIHIFVY